MSVFRDSHTRYMSIIGRANGPPSGLLHFGHCFKAYRFLFLLGSSIQFDMLTVTELQRHESCCDARHRCSKCIKTGKPAGLVLGVFVSSSVFSFLTFPTKIACFLVDEVCLPPKLQTVRYNSAVSTTMTILTLFIHNIGVASSTALSRNSLVLQVIWRDSRSYSPQQLYAPV